MGGGVKLLMVSWRNICLLKHTDIAGDSIFLRGIIMKKTKDTGILPPAELLAEGENSSSASAFSKTRKAVFICKTVVAAIFLVTLLIGLFLPVTQQKYTLTDMQGNELWSASYNYSATQGVIGTVSYLTTFNKAPSETGAPIHSVEEEVSATRKNKPSTFERAGYLQSWLMFEEDNRSTMYRSVANIVSKEDFNNKYAESMVEQLQVFGGEIEAANLLGANRFIELHQARGYRADGGATQDEQKIIDDEMAAWFAENAAKYLVDSYEWSPELSMSIDSLADKLAYFSVTDDDGIYYLYKESVTGKSDGAALNRRGGIGSPTVLCYDVMILLGFIVSFIQFIIITVSLIKSLKNGESTRMKRLGRGYAGGFGTCLAAAIVWAVADSVYFKKALSGEIFTVGFLLNASAIVCMIFSVLGIASIIVYNKQLKKMKTVIDEWVEKQPKA